jgi:hypothetical protein
MIKCRKCVLPTVRTADPRHCALSLQCTTADARRLCSTRTVSCTNQVHPLPSASHVLDCCNHRPAPSELRSQHQQAALVYSWPRTASLANEASSLAPAARCARNLVPSYLQKLPAKLLLLHARHVPGSASSCSKRQMFGVVLHSCDGQRG